MIGLLLALLTGKTMKYEPVIQSEMLITNKIQTKEIEVESQKVSVSSVPVGAIFYFSFKTPPEGYLVCNGGAISRETYSELFSVCGTTFGTGDDSTTFNIPNLINRFPHGHTTVGTVKAAGLPNITGAFGGLSTNPKSTTDSRYRKASGGFSMSTAATSIGPTENSGWNMILNNFNAASANAIYGSSTTVQPPALTLLPCIKY